MMMSSSVFDISFALLEAMCVIVLAAYLITRSKYFTEVIENQNTIKNQAILIVFFGALSVYGTLMGVDVMGAVMNVRDLGPLAAGLFCGPVVGLGAGLIGGAFRTTQGGFTLVPCTLATILAGLFAGAIHVHMKGKFPGVLMAASFAILFEVFHVSLVMLIARPYSLALDVSKTALPPLALANAAGILIFTQIASNLIKERRTEAERDRYYDDIESKNIELKIAADALKKSEKRLSNIIDFLPDATFVVDLGGEVISWNKAMEHLTQVKAADILGQGDYEYSLPFYSQKRPMLIDFVLKPDEHLEKEYEHFERKEGTIIAENLLPNLNNGTYLFTTAAALHDSEGNTIGAIESLRDVTDRKMMEQTLQRSKAELHIAAQIQKSFMPDHAPEVSGYKLAAVTIPAMEVGGDFYDFISLPDGRQGLVIADVAGKSIPAALFMALSRTIIRANAIHWVSAADALREANNMISEDASAGMFVTLFYGILDGKAHTLTYANAGHPPPLIFRPDCWKCAEQEVTGIALGAWDGAEYEERQVQFCPGDIALLYTDGVTEAINGKGELYGIKRLCQVITKSSRLSAQQIMEKVQDDILEFSGQDQYDDITMIVLKAE
jgi:PAS domain S-box-containing protein